MGRLNKTLTLMVAFLLLGMSLAMAQIHTTEGVSTTIFFGGGGNHSTQDDEYQQTLMGQSVPAYLTTDDETAGLGLFYGITIVATAGTAPAVLVPYAFLAQTGIEWLKSYGLY